MRITGGSAKGRKVGIKKVFNKRGENDGLRPTSEKVRQAVFNILGDRISGSRFLDLFAGTGAVGLEALSRGASVVVFVEENSLRVSVLRDLVTRFGFEGMAEVIREEATRFLRKNEDVFDIVFMDPPYASEAAAGSLALLDELQALRPGGVVIVEHPTKRLLAPEVGELSIKKSYRYGDTSLSLYTKQEKEDA